MTDRQILIVIILFVAVAVGYRLYSRNYSPRPGARSVVALATQRPSDHQRAQMRAAFVASVATCEKLLGRPLDAVELACVHVDFKDGRIVGDIAAPLSQTLQERQTALGNQATPGPLQSMSDISRATGMTKYTYLATDGGPDMLLPANAADDWFGTELHPSSDYERACAATARAPLGAISVDGQPTLVFANPPLAAWGKCSGGLVDIYVLHAWTGMDLDSLLARASRALPTAQMTDTGIELHLDGPNAYLLFAGDMVEESAYGAYLIPMQKGDYWVLTGDYKAKGDAVTVYRLQRAGN